MDSLAIATVHFAVLRRQRQNSNGLFHEEGAAARATNGMAPFAAARNLPEVSIHGRSGGECSNAC